MAQQHEKSPFVGDRGLNEICVNTDFVYNKNIADSSAKCKKKDMVKVCVDNIPYTQKPDSQEAGKIVNRIIRTQSDYTLEEIAQRLLCGATITLSEFEANKNPTGNTFIKQYLLIVDIDNEKSTILSSVEDCLKICNTNNLKPFLIYYTFSHSNEKPKFRLVFVLDVPIEHKEQAEKATKGLVSLFSQADPACTNVNRLVYGTSHKEPCYLDYNARVAAESLLTLYEKANKPIAQQKQASFTKKYDNGYDLKREIQTFDFVNFILSENPQSTPRGSKEIKINPCPICGHRDCFSLNTEKNTYVCFSANGQQGKGGTIIDYLMFTRQLDQKEAIRMFLYDILNKPKIKLVRSAETVSNYIEAQANIETNRPIFIEAIEDRNGIVKERINRAVLAEVIRKNELYIIVQDGIGSIMVYWYISGVYRLISPETFKAKIKKYITDYSIDLLKMADIDEVYKNLMTDGNYHKDSELNSNRDIINFKNGNLNLVTRKLEPHNPKILSTIQIPCNYNPQNKKSDVFDLFIKQFASNDDEKIRFYLQWIAVIISNIPVHIFKKALLVIGKPHSGKSVLLDFLIQCLGSEICASIDLSYIEKNNFALSTLHNKRLGYCGDMSFIKIDELKSFKTITGGDSIKIEYKGQKPFSTIFKGALMFNSNSFPKFGGDTGKAVFDRFIVLSADNVLPENKRDNLLREKLYAEREGIISKAIDELYKVIDNGYKFDIPLEHERMIDNYKTENSHAVEFYKEYCIDRPVNHLGELLKIHDSITQKVVYSVFKEWSTQTHGNAYITSKKVFEQEICNYLEVDKIDKKTNGGNAYYSFIINKLACNEFGYYDDNIKKDVMRIEAENNNF